jgi:hypothetical protein
MPTTKILEASHTIISVTLLASGRLIMATEKRMYELVGNIWTPMQFAPEEPEPEPTPTPETAAPVEPEPAAEPVTEPQA